MAASDEASDRVYGGNVGENTVVIVGAAVGPRAAHNSMMFFAVQGMNDRQV
jgi:hypothetical protein